MAGEIEREVLLGPDLLAKAAAQFAGGNSAPWMLHQSKDVRRSYVEQVLEREDVDEERARQEWMLAQPDKVRSGYLEKVLAKRAEPPPKNVVWMLNQPDAVRRSYVEQVLRAEPEALKPQVVWMLRQPDAVRESYLSEVVLEGG